MVTIPLFPEMPDQPRQITDDIWDCLDLNFPKEQRKKLGALVGAAIRNYGPERTYAAVLQLSEVQPLEPVPYFCKIIKKNDTDYLKGLKI